MKLTLGNQEIEITEEQHQKIAEALNLKTTDQVDSWPQGGDSYWSLDADGNTERAQWDAWPSDHERRSIGNLFKTEEEAETHVRYLKALTRVKGSSSFVPEWDDTDQMKHFVAYDTDRQALHTNCTSSYVHIGTPVYYESREGAEQAIKDHKEDFLILAGVK